MSNQGEIACNFVHKNINMPTVIFLAENNLKKAIFKHKIAIHNILFQMCLFSMKNLICNCMKKKSNIESNFSEAKRKCGSVTVPLCATVMNNVVAKMRVHSLKLQIKPTTVAAPPPPTKVVYKFV